MIKSYLSSQSDIIQLRNEAFNLLSFSFTRCRQQYFLMDFVKSSSSGFHEVAIDIIILLWYYSYLPKNSTQFIYEWKKWGFQIFQWISVQLLATRVFNPWWYSQILDMILIEVHCGFYNQGFQFWEKFCAICRWSWQLTFFRIGFIINLLIIDWLPMESELKSSSNKLTNWNGFQKAFCKLRKLPDSHSQMYLSHSTDIIVESPFCIFGVSCE